MFFKRLALVGLTFGIGLATSACTDGYGYSGVQVGYGTGGYYDDGYGYGAPYGGGYGYGGYPSYFGWAGDYYYPGTGIYVYDQYRRPYRWNDSQRRYWEGRRNAWRGDRNFRNDWNGFNRNDGRWQGNRDGQWRGNRAPGYRNDGNRGDRTPGYRGDGNRGDRGPWRGNRPNVTGQPSATPQATPQATPGQRTWGGNRGGWNGNRNWSGGAREGRGNRNGGERGRR